ncbi:MULTISPECIES: hypothetical protein [unclassified Paraflavitalea]|uniref:hypothetical protein n=1 Tax=unclassified Paraflavitalea TaxID=2798305 RepID=UPI003D327E0F
MSFDHFYTITILLIVKPHATLPGSNALLIIFFYDHTTPLGSGANEMNGLFLP